MDRGSIDEHRSEELESHETLNVDKIKSTQNVAGSE